MARKRKKKAQPKKGRSAKKGPRTPQKKQPGNAKSREAPFPRLTSLSDPPTFHQDEEGNIHIHWTPERRERAMKMLAKIIARRVVERITGAAQRPYSRSDS